MPEYVYVMRTHDVPEGEVRPAEVNGRQVLVCNDGGRFHVVDAICPHEGAFMAGGSVRDGCVICPRHRWPWNLETGLTDLETPYMKLNIHPSRVEDGRIYTRIDPDAPDWHGRITDRTDV